MLLTAILASVLTLGSQTLPPMQWSLFAKDAPKADITITTGRPGPARDLHRINDWVNGVIAPSTGTLTATTPWRISPKTGWCGDYAVTKRHLLLKAGWPSWSLRLAVVALKDGTSHAVLLARMNDTWLALDNIERIIKPASALSYRPILIQGVDPNKWYALPELPQ